MAPHGAKHGMRPMLKQLLRSALRYVPDGSVMPVLSGPLRGTRWLIRSGTLGYWLGTYEPQMQQLLHRLLIPGQIFYDVGAHAGFHTLLAARLVGPSGRVVAFEPHPANVANLRHHVTLNRASNVVVVEAAAADRSGSGSLEEGTNSFVARLSPDGRIWVDILSLDDYANQSGFIPNLIKIDAEGAEMLVIAGARALMRRLPTILVSVHRVEGIGDLSGMLRACGYQVTTLHHPRAPEAALLLATPYPTSSQRSKLLSPQ